MSVNHRCGRLIHPALEVDLLKMGENSVKRGNREKPYVILNDINYAGIQKNEQPWSSLESTCMHGKQPWNTGSGQEYNYMVLKG